MKPLTAGSVAALIIFFAVGCNRPAAEMGSVAPQASPTPAASSSPADVFAASRANFTKNCEPCHGATGEGGLVTIDDKRLKVPSFKAERAMKHTDEQFIKQILNGGEGMPRFKDKLTPTEINDLVRSIRHQFQGK